MKKWIDNLVLRNMAATDQLLTDCARDVDRNGAFEELNRAQALMAAGNNTLGLKLLTLGYTLAVQQTLRNIAESLDTS